MKKFSFVIIAVLFSAMNVCAQTLGTKQVKKNVYKQMSLSYIALDIDGNGDFSDDEMWDAQKGNVKFYYDYAKKKLTLDFDFKRADGINSGNIHCEAEGIELMTFTKNDTTYYNFVRDNGTTVSTVCHNGEANSLVFFDVFIIKSFEKSF